LKQFDVTTALADTRVAIIASIDGITFNDDFVIGNVDFLQDKLLDTGIDLNSAIKGARPIVASNAQAVAVRMARRALHYLYLESNMFNLPPIGGSDVNLPATAFDSQFSSDFWRTGLGDSLRNDFAEIYTTLGFFYKLMTDPVLDPLAQSGPDDS